MRQDFSENIPNDSNLILHVNAGLILSLADLSKQLYDNLSQSNIVQSSCDQGNDATGLITPLIDGKEREGGKKTLKFFFRSHVFT